LPRFARFFTSRLPVVALVLLLSGCGGGTSSDDLLPVQGRIFYRGVAVTHGTIVFSPDAARGGNGALARAEIQPDGRYLLRTGERLGAAAGPYQVSVVAVAKEDASVPNADPSAAPRLLLPPRYRDPEQSGLGCQVEHGKDNTFDFYLD
jgi:hypothetical protein